MTDEQQAAPEDTGTTDEQLGQGVDTQLEQGSSVEREPHRLVGGEDPMDRIPEKFIGEDGEPDYKKLVKSYNHLEKMQGKAPEGVPKTADEYEVPEQLRDHAIVDFNDESTKEFMKGALEKGFTKDQLAWVFEQYAETMEQIVPNAQAIEANLTEAWGEDEYDANISAAADIIEEFGKELSDEEVVGNAPLIKFAAAVAKALGQDKPDIRAMPNEADPDSALDVLMSHPDYFDKESDVRKRADALLERMSS